MPKKILYGVLTFTIVLFSIVAFIVVRADAAVEKPEIYSYEMVIDTIDGVERVVELVNYSESDIDMLARVIYTEARGIDSDTEKAAVVWCILNRVDNREQSIRRVITAPHQFAYSSKTPVTHEFRDLAEDVCERWFREKLGCEDVGRILPKEYEYFSGKNGRNRFRAEYRSKSYWDWSLPSPYEE